MDLVYYVILIVIFLVIGWYSTTGVKSQLVRLGDVFIFGPFLIWCAFMVEARWLKVGLIAFGATTISYNAKNWIHKNRELRVLSV
jgi:hypothetical protein